MPFTNPPDGKDNGRYFMSSVKIGPKGQIVIPKEVRDMFGIAAETQIVLLADRERGIALQTTDILHPMLRQVFDALPKEETEV